MANQLKKYFSTLDQIQQGYTINSWHVSQSIDAFTGSSKYDIKISGSLEVIGDLIYNPINNINPGDLELLGRSSSTGKIYSTSLIANIYPIELNSLYKYSWNSGKGNIDNNTVFGKDTFRDNTIGSNNTIFGFRNSTSNVSGINNIIFGSSILSNSNNSYNNIGIGTNLLNSTSLAHSNVIIGISSFTRLEGMGNISIGNNNIPNSPLIRRTIILGNSSYPNLQSSGDNISIGNYTNKYVFTGSNRVTIGNNAGHINGDHVLEIHSSDDPVEAAVPLISGHFRDRFFLLNGNFRINPSYNPSTNINNTPNQLLFDNNGNSYLMPRSYTTTESWLYFQPSGSYITTQDINNYYTKPEVDNKFYNQTSETLTQLLQPTISGTNLTIKYVGEDGGIQQHTIDLSGGVPSTNEIFIDGATYDASLNIITINRNDGTSFSINLSEFQLLVNTNPDGTTSINQEGVTKLILSKVATTGNYGDLLNKPTTLSGFGITDALDTSVTDQTKIGGLSAKYFATSGGNSFHFVKGDGTLDSTQYLPLGTFNQSASNFVTLNTEQTITSKKIFDENQIFTKDIILHPQSPPSLPLFLDYRIRNEGDLLRILSTNGSSVTDEGISINALTESVNTNYKIYANQFIKNGGTADQFLKADGSIDSSTYLTGETVTHIEEFILTGSNLELGYRNEDNGLEIKIVDLTPIADKYHEHFQNIPSNSWEIWHYLGRRVNITVTNEFDIEIEGEVILNNTERAIVNFNNYYIGKAHCS